MFGEEVKLYHHIGGFLSLHQVIMIYYKKAGQVRTSSSKIENVPLRDYDRF